VVAFVVSTLALILGVGIVIVFMRRRPVGAPLTWGEAYVAATFVFLLMFHAYGVWPHQWLNWADNELRWRKDSILLDTYAIDVTKEALRDVIAVLIYAVALGLQIALFAMWQNRGKKKPAELPTSPFGRPLVRKS
jgi:hypothetical protein